MPRVHFIQITLGFYSKFLETRKLEKKNAKALRNRIPQSHLLNCHLNPIRTEDAVIRYDFQLSDKHTAQIEQCATRLVDYLQKYNDRYTLKIGYATSRAYRAVFALAEERFPMFIVLPKELRQKRLAEFFRHTNIDTLTEVIQDKL